jgi:hypothetical protein
MARPVRPEQLDPARPSAGENGVAKLTLETGEQNEFNLA